MSEEINVKEPPILFDETQLIINQLKEHFNAPLICYWNNPRGSICGNDVLALYEGLERIGKHEVIYLFIKSSGGNGTASLRFVSLLRQYCKRLVALVPAECSSAATMIALGADDSALPSPAGLRACKTGCVDHKKGSEFVSCTRKALHRPFVW